MSLFFGSTCVYIEDVKTAATHSDNQTNRFVWKQRKQRDYENERGLISPRVLLIKEAFRPTWMKFLPPKKFSNLQFFEKGREIAKDFWTFALNFSKKDYFSPPRLFQQGFKTKPSLFKGSVYPYPAQGHRHGLRFRAAFESWVQPDPRVCRKQGVFVQSNSMGKKLAFFWDRLSRDWMCLHSSFVYPTCLSYLLNFQTVLNPKLDELLGQQSLGERKRKCSRESRKGQRKQRPSFVNNIGLE